MECRRFILVAALLATATFADADETTLCNFYITSLPYSIFTQGHYCFDRNLSTAMTSGNAIGIYSDFVVLDLNNFKLGGGSAGLGTNTIGINVDTNRNNITIRNGNIRGFRIGIAFGSVGDNDLVETNVLDGNTNVGISVGAGGTSVIRNNLVINTGGSTQNPDRVIGIGASATNSGSTTAVRDNIVSNTFNSSTYYTVKGTIGIFVEGGLADHNLVSAGTVAKGTAVGIYGYRVAYCRDNTVLNNTPGLAYPGCTQIGPPGSNDTNAP